MNPSTFFNEVEENRMASIPYYRSTYQAKPLLSEVVRDIADHPLCFVPGCENERHKSRYSRQKDGRSLVCIEHIKTPAVTQASIAKRKWLRGEDA